jgi:hypothetical protein
VTPNFDRMWGSILRSVDIDVAAHRVVIDAVVTNRGSHTLHRVTCDGVVELRVFDESSDHWDYAEITAASSQPEFGGLVVVHLVMWIDEAGIVVRCRAVSIVTEELSGPDAAIAQVVRRLEARSSGDKPP